MSVRLVPMLPSAPPHPLTPKIAKVAESGEQVTSLVGCKAPTGTANEQRTFLNRTEGTQRTGDRDASSIEGAFRRISSWSSTEALVGTRLRSRSGRKRKATETSFCGTAVTAAAVLFGKV